MTTEPLTLSRLKQYMQDNREATMQGLMITFNEPPEHIETLMEHLIQKGLVKADDECVANCGTACGTCQFSTMKLYRWREAI